MLEQQLQVIVVLFLSKLNKKNQINLEESNIYEKNFLKSTFSTVEKYLSKLDIKIEQKDGVILIPEQYINKTKELLQVLVSKTQKDYFDYIKIAQSNLTHAQEALIKKYSSWFNEEKTKKFLSV